MANKLASARLPTPPLPEQDESHRQSLPLTEHEARIIRLYMERVALRLEQKSLMGNRTYKSVFQQAANMVRESKPD